MLNSLKWQLQTSIKSIVFGFNFVKFPLCECRVFRQKDRNSRHDWPGPHFYEQDGDNVPLIQQEEPKV